MIEPPKDAELIIFKKHIFWFDSNGILCAKSISNDLTNLKDVKEFTEYFIERLQGKKVSILHDFSNVSYSSKEIRDYVTNEFPKIAVAIAMVSKTPLGRMMANLFFNLKQNPYATKMFDNEDEAKEWLKKYL